MKKIIVLITVLLFQVESAQAITVAECNAGGGEPVNSPGSGCICSGGSHNNSGISGTCPVSKKNAGVVRGNLHRPPPVGNSTVPPANKK